MLDKRHSQKRTGAYFTPRLLADFVAKNTLKHINLAGSKQLKIIDPAIGDGELILSLLGILKNYAGQIEVYGFDINGQALDLACARIANTFPGVHLRLFNTDFLDTCFHKTMNLPLFDILIANPPYVRTQTLGQEKIKQLGAKFGLKGQIDIYHAFLAAIQPLLKPDAIAGVIISNRFMTIKSCNALRKTLMEQYAIKQLWDLGDTKLFGAAVLPAVMLLTPRISTAETAGFFTSIYEYKGNHPENEQKDVVAHPVDALNHSGVVKCKNQKTYLVRHGTLTFDKDSSEVWRLHEPESEKWLAKVNKHTWATFKDIGKIRVGVKTTADSVFINSDWKKAIGYEPELLLPLTTHHVAGRFRRTPLPLKSILYTHYTDNGVRKVIDLEQFPLTKIYLQTHYKTLSSRTYIHNSRRKWYEIWVPQDPDAWQRTKLIFKDISEKPLFWIDTEKTVVNGDCYWMTRDNDTFSEDILWLAAAVANSTFIEKFYDIKFHNKLYSNRRRFITQYVEQFPIPDPSTRCARELIELAKSLHHDPIKQPKNQETKINQLVLAAFNLNNIEP